MHLKCALAFENSPSSESMDICLPHFAILSINVFLFTTIIEHPKAIFS